MRLISALPAVLALTVSIVVAGCASPAKDPVGVTHVTYGSAPTIRGDIQTYPHTWYQGRSVYLINGTWWYKDDGRWAYYSPEPDHLAATRKLIEEPAPAGTEEQAIRHIDSPAPAH
jgi:hypothetical protein